MVRWGGIGDDEGLDVSGVNNGCGGGGGGCRDGSGIAFNGGYGRSGVGFIHVKSILVLFM